RTSARSRRRMHISSRGRIGSRWELGYEFWSAAAMPPLSFSRRLRRAAPWAPHSRSPFLVVLQQLRHAVASLGLGRHDPQAALKQTLRGACCMLANRVDDCAVEMSIAVFGRKIEAADGAGRRKLRSM